MTKKQRRYLRLYYKDLYELNIIDNNLENTLYNTFSFQWYLLFIEFTLLKKEIIKQLKNLFSIN